MFDQKKWYQDNKEKISEKLRKDYKEDIGGIKTKRQEYQKKYYYANKESILESQRMNRKNVTKEKKEKRKENWRKWYQKNKQEYNKKQYMWCAKNPEKVKQMKKKWADNNKEKIKERRKKWKSSLKGFMAIKIGHLKKAKRARKLTVSINADFLVKLWKQQKGICAISQYPMIYPECTLFSATVDRIDPAGDYTKDNVQLVCQGINFAKNKYGNQEFIDFWNYREKLKTKK
jgi:hypothetical protein